MLGSLRAFFAALSRLTASVNRSADLFDAANEQLAERLGFEEQPAAAALEHNGETRRAAKSGRGK